MWSIIIAIWVSGKMVAHYPLPSPSVSHVACIERGLALMTHWQGRNKRTKFGFMCVRHFEA